MMKPALIAAAALVALSSTAMAAPGHGKYRQGHHAGGHVSFFERVAIKRSQLRLRALKRQAWRDGRLTRFERIRIRNAEAAHNRLVRRARRS